MIGENYAEALNVFHPLSSGLKAYLSTIAKKTVHKKGETIFFDKEKHAFFPMVESGRLRLLTIDKETDEEILLGLIDKRNFLYHIANVLPKSRFELYLEFIEDSYIVAISEKHYANLLKLFPDAYLLNLSFTTFHFNILLAVLIENDNRNHK